MIPLNELAMFLPYGLEFMSGHYLVGIYVGDDNNITRPLLMSETKNGSIDWEANLDMDKPLVYPLYYLTKEIEHNGEKFVPIMKLANIHQSFNDDEIKRLYCFENDYCYCVNYNTGGDEDDCIFAIYKENELSVSYNKIQYLLKWKLDVFGWLDNGLAVDINKINK